VATVTVGAGRLRVRAGEVADAAEEALGLERLRPGQEEAARSAASGRDTLAVLPTGWGKSAIYQIAGHLRPGATVVVSPLIALQRDHVESLAETELTAAAVNSTVGAAGRRAAFEGFVDGGIEFLFVSPEQLADDEVLATLGGARPSLVVVDEAHCVASWGHDFRPDYLRLGDAIDRLGRPPVLALTATAAPMTRSEIVHRLGMRDPAVVVRGFDRPNLQLSVRTFADDDDRRRDLLALVGELEGDGIVYAATRRATEEIARALADRGVRAEAYHAGLAARRRAERQDRFMSGDLRVVVATTAFGMGIDKPDVRFVVHAHAPESLDAYYQEIGRAGRDGEPAEAVLLHRTGDLGLRRFQQGGAVGEERLAAVARAVEAAGRHGIGLAELRKVAGVGMARVRVGLDHLAATGVLEADRDAARWLGGDAGEAARDAAGREEVRRRVDRSRVEQVGTYAATPGCRRQVLLAYLGEPYDPPCGACDNCRSGRRPPTGDDVDVDGGRRDGEVRPWPVGSTVHHDAFGAGRVMGYDRDVVTVAFDDHGYRTLQVDLAASALGAPAPVPPEPLPPAS
jgi:ATP-dependent DNA helicase RecQ